MSSIAIKRYLITLRAMSVRTVCFIRLVSAPREMLLAIRIWINRRRTVLRFGRGRECGMISGSDNTHRYLLNPRPRHRFEQACGEKYVHSGKTNYLNR